MTFHQRISEDQKGFSLIELTVVLTIVALLIAGVASLFHSYMTAERVDEQETKIASVEDALAHFIASDMDENGVLELRYPCPADPSITPGSDGYGEEQRDASGTECLETGAIVKVTNPNTGGDVFIGALPFASLGISSEAALDVYKNQLTYAISESLVSEGSLATLPLPQGDVEILQVSGGVPSLQHFAVVSHGLDGAGAFTAEGIESGLACPGDGESADAENCDRDDVVFAEFERSEAANNEFFDDGITFSLVGALDQQEDPFWAISPADPDDIFARNIGNVGIGTEEPAGTLDVAGTVKLSEVPAMSCSGIVAGTMRFNVALGEMEFCDGTRWRPYGGTRVASGIADDTTVINLADHGFDPDGPRPHVFLSARDHNKAGVDGNTEDASFCQHSTVSKLEFEIQCRASTDSVSGFNAPSEAHWMAFQTPAAKFGEGEEVVEVAPPLVLPPANCPSQSISWRDPSTFQVCSGSLGAKTHGGSSTAVDRVVNDCDSGGSATYVCNNGAWTGPTSATCVTDFGSCAGTL